MPGKVPFQSDLGGGEKKALVVPFPIPLQMTGGKMLSASFNRRHSWMGLAGSCYGDSSGFFSTSGDGEKEAPLSFPDAKCFLFLLSFFSLFPVPPSCRLYLCWGSAPSTTENDRWLIRGIRMQKKDEDIPTSIRCIRLFLLYPRKKKFIPFPCFHVHGWNRSISGLQDRKKDLFFIYHLIRQVLPPEVRRFFILRRFLFVVLLRMLASRQEEVSIFPLLVSREQVGRDLLATYGMLHPCWGSTLNNWFAFHCKCDMKSNTTRAHVRSVDR